MLTLNCDSPGGGGRVMPGDRSECIENVRESRGKCDEILLQYEMCSCQNVLVPTEAILD